MWKKLVASRNVRFRYVFIFLCALTFAHIVEAQEGILEQWHWRNPLPQGNALRNVVFVNGNWVAVGQLGTILFSADGTNWVRRESGVTDELRDCTFAQGKYVVVGEFGTVLTSVDGITWTSQFAGTFYSLSGITFANGQFVAVGDATTILTSVDGVIWQQRVSGEWDLFDVIYDEGVFVAVGGKKASASVASEGVILTSPDGQIWTRRLRTWYGPFLTVAYGEGKFGVASGSQYGSVIVQTSDDAITWETSPGPTYYGPVGLFYGQGKWLLGASYYFDSGVIMVSSDLLTWTQAAAPTLPVGGIATGNGKFIAALENGTFSLSSNGLDWTGTTFTSLSSYSSDLEYLNGAFVSVGGNQLLFSKNGSIWTNLITVTNVGNLVSVTYGHGRYVAGSEHHTVLTSVDGLNWTNPAPDLSVSLNQSEVYVAFGNGVFVGAVAGNKADVMTSPDGLNWEVQQLEPDDNSYISFTDVTFGGGRFVAVGPNVAATSIDGTNWNFANTSVNVYGVTYGNGKFVGVGFNTIATSIDGINWTAQAIGPLGFLANVAFGGGYFVASGSASDYSVPNAETPILISTDGINWSSRHSTTSRHLYRAAFGDGTFVLTGEAGAILQSDPVVNLTIEIQPALQLRVWGPVDRNYRIEYREAIGASNQWTELETKVGTEMPLTFHDSGWTNGMARFYRAVLLP